MPILELIARDFGLDLSYISSIVWSASHRYKTYRIAKATGGFRVINHPSKELKTLQYWVNNSILSDFAVHPCASAYSRGCSIRKNASHHMNNNFLLRIDLEAFFESLTDNDFFNKFRMHPIQSKLIVAGETVENYVFTDNDILLMSKILFRHGRMTIGAPSSPLLSNVLMYDFDEEVNNRCKGDGVVYTRYADDMFFSTKQPGLLRSVERYVLDIINRLECPANLKINNDKTRHNSKKTARYITGLSITSDGRISIGRDKKREVKSRIHKYLISPDKSNLSNEKSYISGYLSHIKSVEPKFYHSLVLKYGKRIYEEFRQS